MEKYLVLYRSTMTSGEEMAGLSSEEMQAEMDAWMAWGTDAGDALVDWGSPTQPTSDDDPGPAGWIGGYSILQAEDLAEVQAVLATHPHQRAGTIEILAMLPMPGG